VKIVKITFQIYFFKKFICIKIKEYVCAVIGKQENFAAPAQNVAEANNN
jgi:hypothetical protein